MSILEWIGIIATFIFAIQWALNIYKSKNPEKYSKDPGYSNRQFEFNRMVQAFEKLRDLRDMNYELYSEAVSNVQGALEEVVHSTVPLTKDAFASDYRSKYVDYTVIHYLASNIINSEIKNIAPAKEELKIKWD